MKHAFLELFAVVTVVGCASSTENLQRETARSTGNITPEAVAVAYDPSWHSHTQYDNGH